MNNALHKASCFVVAIVLYASPLNAAQRLTRAEVQASQAETHMYQHDHVRKSQRYAQPPGLSCAVGLQGTVVWAGALGFADLEQRVAVTSRTRFRIGSVSKTFTAVAAALLWQERKLDIDAPVQRYVPSFPDKGAQITVRELAGHLGGIRGYGADEFPGLADNQTHYSSVLAGLSIFEHDPLVAAPGTTFVYSSFGYNLIGAAIEGASGESYPRFVTEHIFAPLGMTNTSVDDVSQIIPDRARGYDIVADGGYVNAPFIDSSYKIPAAGFVSTPSDLVRFAGALQSPGLLSAATLKLLYTPQIAASSGASDDTYAFGWQTSTVDDGFGPERTIGHEGDIVGGHALLIVYPAYDVAVACAENTDDLQLDSKELRAIAEPFIDGTAIRKHY
jgi:serine beta-lactamase-like protein LACTB, mitochondrial